MDLKKENLNIMDVQIVSVIFWAKDPYLAPILVGVEKTVIEQTLSQFI